MNDMYQLLMDIKKKPALYLGKPSLQRLSHLITGYYLCLEKHGLLYEFEFFEGFQSFVQEKYKVTLTQNWANILEFYDGDGEKTFERFFELLEEYLIVNNLKDELTKND